MPPVAGRIVDLAKEPLMSNSVNRQIILRSRPAGEPAEENFALVEAPIPEPGAGQFLARTLYLSLDPYMRGRMAEGP
jgi:NADPH-dependent curcumin reductase